jgi:hypothetical protein
MATDESARLGCGIERHTAAEGVYDTSEGEVPGERELPNQGYRPGRKTQMQRPAKKPR